MLLFKRLLTIIHKIHILLLRSYQEFTNPVLSIYRVDLLTYFMDVVLNNKILRYPKVQVTTQGPESLRDVTNRDECVERPEKERKVESKVSKGKKTFERDIV